MVGPEAFINTKRARPLSGDRDQVIRPAYFAVQFATDAYTQTIAMRACRLTLRETESLHTEHW